MFTLTEALFTWISLWIWNQQGRTLKSRVDPLKNSRGQVTNPRKCEQAQSTAVRSSIALTCILNTHVGTEGGPPLRSTSRRGTLVGVLILTYGGLVKYTTVKLDLVNFMQ